MATGKNVLPRAAKAGRGRPAFTLMELLLVLAIIVVMAALAFPTLKSLYMDEGLTQASDQVRGGWASARSHAINEGIPYRFSVAQGTGHWRVAADQDVTSDNSGNTNINGGEPFVQEGHLPLNIKFGPEGVAQDTSPDQESVDPSQYSRLMTFYPDGSMQCFSFDGTVIEDEWRLNLGTGVGRSVLLIIRPLTGSITTHWRYPDGTIR